MKREDLPEKVKKKDRLSNDIKQHIIYGVLLLLVVSIIVYYGQRQTESVKELLAQETMRLDREIQDLQSNVRGVTGNIKELNVELEKKETSIQQISGELQKVRVESKEQSEVIQSLKTQFQDFSSVIDSVIPTIVSIRTDLGLGSGFIVEKQGYVVTNYHVIQGASAATAITSDGQDHAVRLVDFDRDVDIAVLEISGDSFPVLSFGNSEATEVGERVIAVGSPGGLDFSVTQGIISAVNRVDEDGNVYIQTDVPINPGNSGGPLVDIDGRVIGVNTKKISGFEGVGFAITSNEVGKIVDKMIREDVLNK